MITVDKLAEILNDELTREFLETALELFDDEDNPIDPEHPVMEQVLEQISESINDFVMPLDVDYE